MTEGRRDDDWKHLACLTRGCVSDYMLCPAEPAPRTFSKKSRLAGAVKLSTAGAGRFSPVRGDARRSARPGHSRDEGCRR